jgi:hypothetical protein
VGEADVVAQRLGHLVRGGGDAVRRHHDVAVPFVELRGIGAGGVVAACLDLVEDGLHGGAHIRFAGSGGHRSLLQIGKGH